MDPDVRDRLDEFCVRTRRTRTAAVNMLLDRALRDEPDNRNDDASGGERA